MGRGRSCRQIPATHVQRDQPQREASLLYYGVQTMTSDTRAYLAKSPDLVQWLHGRSAIVAAFGAVFRVDADGRC